MSDPGKYRTREEIDEVRKQGVAKILPLEGANVAQFPMPLLPPSAGDPGSKKT